VSVDGEPYVLRIGGKDTQLLGIDRRAEHAAALAAAACGAGPEVVAFFEAEGALVTQFVDGHALPVEEMRSPESIARVVASLKPFHEGGAIPARFDSFQVVETYATAAAERGVRIPAAHERAAELAAQIASVRGPQPLRPCHNDLLNANFILDGTRLWIVDWEYAGMGDVFFDLANFSVNHELEPDEDDELLRIYFGLRRENDAAALTVMRFMSDFREATVGRPPAGDLRARLRLRRLRTAALRAARAHGCSAALPRGAAHPGADLARRSGGRAPQQAHRTPPRSARAPPPSLANRPLEPVAGPQEVPAAEDHAWPGPG